MQLERSSFPPIVGNTAAVSESQRSVSHRFPLDEMRRRDGGVQSHYASFNEWLQALPPEKMKEKRDEAERLLRRLGITFAVYGASAGAERLIPFDLIPRIIPAKEWQLLAAGLRQRVLALNAFLHDLYHRQEILKAGRIPAEMIFSNPQYRIEMQGVDLPGGLYVHIAGLDVVHTGEGEYYLLEDNLRTPSGVSYMLTNRRMMTRLFPELISRYAVAPIEHYPELLLETLRSVAPEGVEEPNVVLLTPGPCNSAYFEHTFLGQQMGIEVVEARDLFVRNNNVYMRTIEGPVKIDVIYRRLDEDFLDPLAFRADSVLGVPGLLSVYRAGRVTLTNAVGTGVADDKAIYAYVPEMIRFYLGKEPILKNVPTFQLRNPQERAYVLAHLGELVVKEVHGSGGYGMLIGPASTSKERDLFRQRIFRNPENYIAQPTLSLSTCPAFVEQGIAPRHIDLRPFVLSGRTVHLVPGGLTRVALNDGSLVVNSSQGGGTKDTWVLEE